MKLKFHALRQISSVLSQLLVFGLTAMPAAAYAGDLYVTPNGSDKNDGTRAAPFATIQHAAHVAAAGTTVHVAPGTYMEGPLVLNNSGTASERIVFVSARKWGAHIRTNSRKKYNWVVTVNGNYVDVVGFDVAGNAGSTQGIITQASYDRVIGNHVHDVPVPFILGTGGSGITTANYDAGNVEIIGNWVHDVGWADPKDTQEAHGIYDGNHSCRIVNNVVFHNHGYGIQCNHYVSNTLVANNTVFNNGWGGIIVDNNSGTQPVIHDTVVENNIAVYNGNWGIIEYGGGATTDPDHLDKYLNNITYGNNTLHHTSNAGDFWVNPQSIQRGMIYSNPLFVKYTGDGKGDYHLKRNSPAIDAGVSTSAPNSDFDGGSRPQGRGFDVGAYEYVPAL